MKILASSSNILNLPLSFDICVYTDHPILHEDAEIEISAASKEDVRNKLPKGPVISKDRKRITRLMIDEYESFVQRIEDTCEEVYDLVGTYTNESDDLSHYYNYLVRNAEGNIIAKFRIRLRISNHEPKRTKQQQHNKKEELNSEKLHELLSEQQISKMNPYPILVVVNDETFKSYEDAFDMIDERLQRAIEIARR